MKKRSSAGVSRRRVRGLRVVNGGMDLDANAATALLSALGLAREHGGEMSTDQIDVMVGDAEMSVRFPQLAALVGIRAAEGRGEERLQVTPLATKVDAIEERRHFWIADEAIVEEVDHGVYADHAADPLEGCGFGRRGHDRGRARR